MFATYSYLTEKLNAQQLFDIKRIYRVRGIASIDEMLNDLRNGVECPCIAVDMGFDGQLDLLDKQYDKSYHTIHILTGAPSPPNDVAMIDKLIESAYKLGRKILEQMANESGYFQPAYGFDAKSVHYSAIGPVGMQVYGVTFDFVCNNDFGG